MRALDAFGIIARWRLLTLPGVLEIEWLNERVISTKALRWPSVSIVHRICHVTASRFENSDEAGGGPVTIE